MICVGWQAKIIHWMTHILMYEYRCITYRWDSKHSIASKWVWNLALFIVMHYLNELTIKCFCNTFFKHFLIDCNNFPLPVTYDDML